MIKRSLIYLTIIAIVSTVALVQTFNSNRLVDGQQGIFIFPKINPSIHNAIVTDNTTITNQTSIPVIKSHIDGLEKQLLTAQTVLKAESNNISVIENQITTLNNTLSQAILIQAHNSDFDKIVLAVIHYDNTKHCLGTNQNAIGKGYIINFECRNVINGNQVAVVGAFNITIAR